MKLSLKRLYILCLSIYIVCLPLGTINIGGAGSLLKIIGILPIGCSLLNVRNRRYKINKQAMLYLVYSALSFLSILWSINSSSSQTRAATLFQLFLLVTSSSFFSIRKDDVRTIKTALIWSSRITVILLFSFGSLYEGRLTFIGALNEDPNYLCMYFSFGLVYAVDCILKNPKRLWRVIGVAEALIYLYAVLETGSRGGLLAILISIGSYIFIYTDRGKSTLFNKIRMSIFIISCVFAFYWLLLFVSPMMVERFSIEEVLASGGTGRIVIWRNGINMFVNSSVFRQILGYGSATVMRAFISSGYAVASVMHNIFLETLVELGGVGLIIYVWMIFSFLISAYKKSDKFGFCVMLGFIVLSLSTSIYTFKPYINIMLFIVLETNSLSTDNIRVI